jgi:hypothetical protein
MRRIACRRAARPSGSVGHRQRCEASSRHSHPVALVGATLLALLALAGCGQGGGANREPSVRSPAVKSEFTRAADRICTAHLETMLGWLRRPHRGNSWQRRAAQDDGTYRIMANTIQRLEALGSAPGPTAAAFADYVKTLKARAALYRLTGMADRQRDNLSASQFQHRVEQINNLGDQDAHRYGLHICGATLGDLAKALRPVED